MFTQRTLLAAVGLVVAVAGCSRPNPVPQPVYAQPVYDKYGAVVDGGGCSSGQSAPGAASSTDCLPPDYQRVPDPTGAGSGTSGGGQAGTAPRT